MADEGRRPRRTGAAVCASCGLPRRKALPTTMIDDSDIAMAASKRRHLAQDRDRNGDRVVGHGEQQVLADQAAGLAGDLDRLRHRRQALPQEDEIGGVAPDIGGRCRRHRDMRCGQGRGIVQPVADHQDLPSRRGDRGDMGDLVAPATPARHAECRAPPPAGARAPRDRRTGFRREAARRQRCDGIAARRSATRPRSGSRSGAVRFRTARRLVDPLRWLALPVGPVPIRAGRADRPHRRCGLRVPIQGARAGRSVRPDGVFLIRPAAAKASE